MNDMNMFLCDLCYNPDTYNIYMPEKNIYIYNRWTVIVNLPIESAQHAHARMITIIVEKV